MATLILCVLYSSCFAMRFNFLKIDEAYDLEYLPSIATFAFSISKLHDCRMIRLSVIFGLKGRVINTVGIASERSGCSCCREINSAVITVDLMVSQYLLPAIHT